MDSWEGLVMDIRDLNRRTMLTPTSRGRERWQAIWLLAQSWTAAATAKALERDSQAHRTMEVCH